MITSGCVDLTIDNQTNNIQLNNAYPTEDSEGQNLDPFIFTVTNHCNVKMDYEIGLETLSDTNLESKYVKVLINEQGKTGSSKLLSTYENESKTIIDGAKEGRILLEGKLEPTTDNNNPSKKDYELRLWLDYDADKGAMSKTFRSKIVLSGVENTPKRSDEVCDTNPDSVDCKLLKNDDKNEEAQLAYDGTEENNLRYIGATPNNYIDIGDRDLDGQPILWRIIGVMNNMTIVGDDDSESAWQSLVKIIRADSIGNWSWDSSASGVNYGYGVNEWSESDLMTTLNSGAYWSKTSGQCYSGSNDSQKACDFSSIGLTKEVRNKIAKVRWNTGTMPDEYSSNTSKTTASYMYQGERSDNHRKKFCSSGSYCNDIVERTSTWDGYIGLMYPSDYGYAVGGEVRNSCLAKTMYNWNGSSPDCKGNDWLLPTSSYEWTLTPDPDSSYATYVFNVYSSGYLNESNVGPTYSVRPVAYLTPGTQIVVGEGTKENPHTLKA